MSYQTLEQLAAEKSGIACYLLHTIEGVWQGKTLWDALAWRAPAETSDLPSRAAEEVMKDCPSVATFDEWERRHAAYFAPQIQQERVRTLLATAERLVREAMALRSAPPAWNHYTAPGPRSMQVAWMLLALHDPDIGAFARLTIEEAELLGRVRHELRTGTVTDAQFTELKRLYEAYAR